MTFKKQVEPIFTPAELRRKMLEDLKRSGLDHKDVEKLGVVPVSAQWIREKTGRTCRGGYLLPYFDFYGKETSFVRVKYLGAVVRIKGEKRVPKYWQPPGSRPEVYMPPYLKWSEVKDDPTVAVVITEGEKKAAIACKMGLACVGLGGVWSWRSKRCGYDLLPTLEEFKWAGRKMEIAYDSDFADNPEVSAAAMTLASQLLAKGAKTYIVRIPSVL